MATAEERFWRKVDKNGPLHRALGSRCWVWTGSLIKGFGQFRVGDKNPNRTDGLAARFSWEIHRGPIAPKTRLKQICGNRACVNPDHLAVGAEDRFWIKVNKNGPLYIPLNSRCWLWLGSRKDEYGYGNFWDGEKVVAAHVFSYQLHNGNVADPSLEMDHVCHNRTCVNPEHLRLATRKQNLENHQGATIRNKLGVRNVMLKNGKYYVQVRHEGKSYYGGYFTDLEKAEEAAVQLRNRLYTHNDVDRSG
jgi:hypothetical protein